ncbi:extracellular solute-binding protein, family 5 Middle [Fodinibius salinus]|uniref:Extracellular solute-binding protein, family 5 Middle n=1 Tax=Fodinibius salinus TaxID=860790 RepID=A0A5D3YIR3_9BACT|nr:ABC transporter substrate-binding protein [Fodinibius salinus]TYP93330.1 extracellular solute-binding protein, family 5 Middle [Fodinibius salinus]
MKSLTTHHKLLIVLSILFLFTGCKQPETVVVDRSPTAAAPDDSVTTTSADDQAGFRQLSIGELQPIHTLDPLFADKASSMRAVQLVYEGLTRLNAQGNIVPGIAKSWQVNNDSTEFTFTIRQDIYYHDNDAFSTGTGRRLKASDVKYVFERMAKINVPPLAAQMFMNISGFNSYFQEQRMVYNPEERNLTGIDGIQIPNSRTVTFSLNDTDPKFLHKLATPLAAIYPSEAVGKSVTDFKAVGTGPFKFSKRDADSTLIFSKFRNYYESSAININRIDIKVYSSESDLFQSMSKGDLYLLPQLGPQLIKNLITDDGQLRNSYTNRYNLQKPGGSTIYAMRHNTNSTLSEAEAQNLKSLMSDSLAYFNQFPDRTVSPTSTNGSQSNRISSDSLDSVIYSSYSDNQFVRTFLGAFSQVLSSQNSSLRMLQIRAPSRDTGLFFTQHYPLISVKEWSTSPLFRFSVQQLALFRSEINGLQFNQHPWWIDVRGVELPAAENMTN